MKTCILVEPRRLEMVEVPIPVPAAGEVLIRVRCVGICGTDVAVYRGDYAAKDGVVLGHEYCGEVVAVGGNTHRFKKGDIVTSAASWGCGACYWCENGTPNYCANPSMLGRTVDGVLAEYVAVDQKYIYPLADNVSDIEGQAVVGLATGLRAVSRSGLKLGDTVLIVGPGYSGLIMLQLCKMAGAKVGMTGTRASRLQSAKALGAEFAINIRENAGWEKDVMAKCGGHGFDICIEASGTVSGLLDAAKLVKKGGQIVAFGTSFDTVNGLPQKDFYSREISIVGSKGGYGFYHRAIAILENHHILIDPLITHKFDFEQVPEAFEVMEKRLENVVRAAVCFRGE